MDTLDTRFQRIANALRDLGEDEREEVLSSIELRLFETDSLLTPEQIAELDRRLALPVEIVPREKIEALFDKYCGTK